MLRERMIDERKDQLAAIRHDEGLAELLRIHLTEPDSRRAPAEAARPDRIPALLGPYRDLATIRHDFPVLLSEASADAPLVPLARLVDEVLPDTDLPDADVLRKELFRLEAAIRQLHAEDPSRRLSELLPLASERLASESDHPERTRAGLGKASAALTLDGRLLDCERDATRTMFEHAWGQLQIERARREGVVLDELIARLSEVLEAERARSPKSSSPEALEAALAGEHSGGIDFDSLSNILRSTRYGRVRVMPVKRAKRLRMTRKVLEAERALLDAAADNGTRRGRSRRRASICESCAEARARVAAELERRVALFRAMRVARLELENRYHEARHDAFFATFGPAQFTPEEYRALPPLLVVLDAASLDASERAALIDLLGSDTPVKVLLEVSELPIADSDDAPPGTFIEWTRRIASMTMAAGDAFVLQTAASHLPQLGADIVAGLRADGPALFCVYSGPPARVPGVSRYLHCASAVESRAFPSFVFNPAGGSDWATRFRLSGSPQPESTWPTQGLDFETPEGAPCAETLAFTAVDFLLLDPRFAQHFVLVPRARWHANMVPVADYLALPAEHRFDKVPFVYLLDAEDRLHRVVVRRALLAFARKCAAHWRSLQELAGFHNSHAQRALERERARLAEEAARAIPAAPADTGAESTPAESATLEAVSVEVAPAPAPAVEAGKAWIDTEMCSSCDDCIRRNPAMFGYNDAKQAYIKDINAGSYRELVEAAENCPVCVIHPGLPRDASEPGVEELRQRAALFD